MTPITVYGSLNIYGLLDANGSITIGDGGKFFAQRTNYFQDQCVQIAAGAELLIDPHGTATIQDAGLTSLFTGNVVDDGELDLETLEANSTAVFAGNLSGYGTLNYPTAQITVDTSGFTGTINPNADADADAASADVARRPGSFPSDLKGRPSPSTRVP